MNMSAPPCMGTQCDVMAIEGFLILAIYAGAIALSIWALLRLIKRAHGRWSN